MTNSTPLNYDEWMFEVKRQNYKQNVDQQLSHLEEEVLKNLQSAFADEEAEYVAEKIRDSQRMSVKPKLEIPIHKKKFKTNRVLLAAGACSIALIAGIKSDSIVNVCKNVSTSIESTAYLNDEVEEFSSKHVVPNTTHYRLDENHPVENATSYDYYEIYSEAKSKSENPIIALYFVYQSIGEDNVNQSIGVFNQLFGTNYQNIDHFLATTNLANRSNWYKFVKSYITEERDLNYNGDYTFRR